MSSHRTSRYRTQKSPDWRFLLVLRVLIFLAFLAFGLGILFWYSLPMSHYYDLNMQGGYRIAMGILIIVYGAYRLLINLPQKEKERKNLEFDDEE
jgi:polyferredoxin